VNVAVPVTIVEDPVLTGALAVIETVPVGGCGIGGGTPGAHCVKPLLSGAAIAGLDDVQVAVVKAAVVGLLLKVPVAVN
jgi:hypothetical protein